MCWKPKPCVVKPASCSTTSGDHPRQHCCCCTSEVQRRPPPPPCARRPAAGHQGRSRLGVHPGRPLVLAPGPPAGTCPEDRCAPRAPQEAATLPLLICKNHPRKTVPKRQKILVQRLKNRQLCHRQNWYKTVDFGTETAVLVQLASIIGTAKSSTEHTFSSILYQCTDFILVDIGKDHLHWSGHGKSMT